MDENHIDAILEQRAESSHKSEAYHFRTPSGIIDEFFNVKDWIEMGCSDNI